MKIKILTTGGTIEGIEKDPTQIIESQMPVSFERYLETAGVSFKYNVQKVFKKDSRDITQNDREDLVASIVNAEEDKILITHGTFTMEDTATYLGTRNLNKTIVLVGSFVLGTLANTDAPFNLGYAISALQFLDAGVYIAMNAEVFHWENVTKNVETNKYERNEN